MALALATILSISNLLALPLSAEGVLETASEAVTTVPEESPAISETTVVPEATEIPEVATVTETAEPEPEVTESLSDEDLAFGDLPFAAAGDVVEEGYCGDTSEGGDGTNLTWTLDSAGTLTISGNGKMCDDFWFSILSASDVKCIELKPGVTSIGNQAFVMFDCVTSVTIPDTVTSIGYGAFTFCESLTSITIPSSVTSIDEMVFFGCTVLTSIEVDGNSSSFCSADGVLFSKDKTELVCYPAGKKDTSYSIPDSTALIRAWAFDMCEGLTEVIIPKSVIYVGSDAFSACDGLTDIYCEAESKPDGWDETWQGENLDGTQAKVYWGWTGFENIPGNVNNDHKLNNQDAIYLLKHVMNHAQYPISQNADVNGDGKINNQDAIYLLKHIMNPSLYPLKNR